MMKYLTEPDVRDEAIDYLKEQLANGNTLATLLLETINFQAGNVAILSPVTLGSAQLLEFNWGHASQKPEDGIQLTIGDRSFSAYPKAGVEEQLAPVIKDWLKKKEYVCLLENELARAGDPWLEHANSCIVLHGAEVYHAVTQPNGTEILRALGEARSLPVFIGAIGPQPVIPICAVSGHGTVSHEQLKQFAESVSCTFAQAYDGEGYVVWSAL